MWDTLKKIAAKADAALAEQKQKNRDPGIYEDWKKPSPVAAVAKKPVPPPPAPAPVKQAPAPAPTARPSGTVQKVYSRAMELQEESLNAYAKRDPLMLSHLLDKRVQQGELTRELANWIIGEARKRRGK
jgi:hypothetical protein